MNLNQDRVPANLEEAVKLLKEAMSDVEKILVEEMTRSDLHLTVGQLIRNEWSLWATENVLTKWFKENYGVDHADDVSGIILECVIADLNDRPRRDKELANEYIDHWNKHKRKIDKKDKE
jgi:hypothetical protein